MGEESGEHYSEGVYFVVFEGEVGKMGDEEMIDDATQMTPMGL